MEDTKDQVHFDLGLGEKDIAMLHDKWFMWRVRSVAEKCRKEKKAFIPTVMDELGVSLKMAHELDTRLYYNKILSDYQKNKRMEEKSRDFLSFLFFCILFVVSAILGTIEIIRCCD